MNVIHLDYLDDVDVRILTQLQRDASLSNQDLARCVHVSPATCLRRVKRLRDAGWIERVVALVSSDQLAAVSGQGLTVVLEVSLDRQGDEEQRQFEARAVDEAAVQQCYRVSSGPDFVLIAHVADMPGYLALAQRLLGSNANVRNVKAYFSVKRAKFDPFVELPRVAAAK